MRKAHNTLLLGLLMGLFLLTACGNTDNPYLPANPDVITTFDGMYPNAQDVYWSSKGAYYVADCRVNSVELDVWFNQNAGWVMTEQDIFRSNLPTVVEDSFSTGEYGNWVIDNLTELTFPKSPSIAYLIEVQQGDKEKALYYTASGVLTLVVDITDADYAVWPDVVDMLG